MCYWLDRCALEICIDVRELEHRNTVYNLSCIDFGLCASGGEEGGRALRCR